MPDLCLRTDRLVDGVDADDRRFPSRTAWVTRGLAARIDAVVDC
jgi:hypothetical protein